MGNVGGRLVVRCTRRSEVRKVGGNSDRVVFSQV